MTQPKGFSAIEILVAIAVLALLTGGVWVWRNQKTSTPLVSSPTPTTSVADRSISKISPTTAVPTQVRAVTPTLSPPAQGITLALNGFAFTGPAGSTRIHELDPSRSFDPSVGKECFAHRDTTLPVTHQVVIDLCIEFIENDSTNTGVDWIKDYSSAALLFEQNEIEFGTLESELGPWYVANNAVDVETSRYYAYLFIEAENFLLKGKWVIEVHSPSKVILENAISSSRLAGISYRSNNGR